jgi:hypothetical protein
VAEEALVLVSDDEAPRQPVVPVADKLLCDALAMGLGRGWPCVCDACSG